MNVQAVKSEQINACPQLVMDFDQKLTRKQDILSALQKALGKTVHTFQYQQSKNVYVYRTRNTDHE